MPNPLKVTLTNWTNWVIQNWVVVAIIVILLIIISWLTRKLAETISEPAIPKRMEIAVIPQSTHSSKSTATSQEPSEIEVLQRYLNSVIRDTEWLKVVGIPYGLYSQRVLLDEVFIDLRFLPGRLPSDHPITREYSRYESALRQGLLTEEMERIFPEIEKVWKAMIMKGEPLYLNDLWHNLIRDDPAAVIQGYPGMGKSTLTTRLALHMARLGLAIPDPLMPRSLCQPAEAPVPILISLKDYSIEFVRVTANDKDNILPIIKYLQWYTEQFSPNLFPFLKGRLEEGQCLVLLDGYDEVSDLELRRNIKDEIEKFVGNYRDNSKTDYNRFLITSRVAGYDVVALNDYQHYVIADLTTEQIDDYLPRWCLASCRINTRDISQNTAPSSNEKREADQISHAILNAIHNPRNNRILDLAENPFLLTLLAIVYRASGNLPDKRVKLYEVITKTLLETRNKSKDIPDIPESQAIERLGPIAYALQEKGDELAGKRNIEASLYNIIAKDGGSSQEIWEEVRNFLERMRLRSGLFVIRAGDSYGFFHRTFQEYFAARYILNQIAQKNTWINTLVRNARRSDELWREPFLLAVGFQSGIDHIIPSNIVSKLLTPPKNASNKAIIHDQLLAADCMLEAQRPLARTFETLLAEKLLQSYEQAQRNSNFYICGEIEGKIRRWLLSLSNEAHRPPIAIVLYEAIRSNQQPELQIATLTLFIMIARSISTATYDIFNLLIPSLLVLCDLAIVGNYIPDNTLQATINYDVADLAQAALSVMGKHGPAGIILSEIRKHFIEYPEHLHQIALYSLQSGTLITPVITPASKNKSTLFKKAIKDSIQLSSSYDSQHITQQQITTCIEIHEQLLTNAEEAAYPISYKLLEMLKIADINPEAWQELWQEYLLKQLKSSTYLSYREAIGLRRSHPTLDIALFQSKRATTIS